MFNANVENPFFLIKMLRIDESKFDQDDNTNFIKIPTSGILRKTGSPAKRDQHRLNNVFLSMFG